MNETIAQSICGSLAGLAATAPMSIVMAIGDQALPSSSQSSLPPRKITLEMAEVAGVRQELTESQIEELTMLSHFGYGAFMGAIYGATAPADSSVTPLARGIAFGLFVWSASYLGWLPAVGSRAAASQQPLHRNTLMLAAHLVWGASLALANQELTRHVAQK